jgi:hypothetical protein
LVSRQHHHQQRPGRDRPAEEANEDEQAESERAQADEDLEQAFRDGNTPAIDNAEKCVAPTLICQFTCTFLRSGLQI